jgi:hypothetical protein
LIVAGFRSPGPEPAVNTPGTVDLGTNGPGATEEDEKCYYQNG